MYIYLFLFLSTAVFSLFELFGVKKNNKTAFYCIFVYFSFYIFLLSGFRYETGSDYVNYVPYFYSPSDSMELGYKYLNLLFNKIFNNYYILQIFIEFFCMFVIGKFIKNYSNNPNLILLLYIESLFFPFNFAMMRQHIAMSICCVGFKYLDEHDYKKYFIFVIAACFFHLSAIFAFSIFFIWKIPSRYHKYLLILSVIITFKGYELIKLFLETSLKLATFFTGSYVFRKLDFYVNYYFSTNTAELHFGTGIGYLVNIFFGILFIYLSKKKMVKKEYVTNFLFYLIFLAIGKNFEVITRIAFYYLFAGGGVLVYDSLSKLKNYLPKSERKLIFLFYLVFITFKLSIILKTLKAGSDGMLPYKIFF